MRTSYHAEAFVADLGFEAGFEAGLDVGLVTVLDFGLAVFADLGFVAAAFAATYTV